MFGAAATATTSSPLCNCKLPASHLVVKKEGPNKGRLFWGCSKLTNSCGFFSFDNATRAAAKAQPLPPHDANTSNSGLGLQQAAPLVKRIPKLSFSATDGGKTLTAVVTHPNADVINALKNHRGRFNADTKCWLLDMQEHRGLMLALSSLRGIAVDDVPYSVLHAGDAAQSAGSAQTSHGAPPSSSSSAAAAQQRQQPAPAPAVPLNLHPQLLSFMSEFQRVGARYCVARKGRAMICDEMGCGKTTTAIAVAAHFSDAWPLLIICPSTLRLNWKVELLSRLSFSGLTESNIKLINTGKDALPPLLPISSSSSAIATAISSPSSPAATSISTEPAQPPPQFTSADLSSATIVIISYDMAATFVESRRLKAGDFNFVIADESHQMKNLDAKRTKYCVPLLQRARHALLLSGTPALNRPKELFSQIACVNRTLFPDYKDFTRRYCAAREMPWGWDDNGSSNGAELNGILEREVLLRRLKSEVLRDLPPKSRRVFTVALAPKSAAELVALRKQLLNLNAEIQRSASEADREALSQRKRGLLVRMFQVSAWGCRRHTKSGFVVRCCYCDSVH